MTQPFHRTCCQFLIIKDFKADRLKGLLESSLGDGGKRVWGSSEANLVLII